MRAPPMTIEKRISVRLGTNLRIPLLANCKLQFFFFIVKLMNASNRLPPMSLSKRLVYVFCGISFASASSGKFFCVDNPQHKSAHTCGITRHDTDAAPAVDMLFHYDAQTDTTQVCPFTVDNNDNRINVNKRCGILNIGTYPVKLSSNSFTLVAATGEQFIFNSKPFVQVKDVPSDSHYGSENPPVELTVNPEGRIQVYGSLQSSPVPDTDRSYTGDFYFMGRNKFKAGGTLGVLFFRFNPPGSLFSLVSLQGSAIILNPAFHDKIKDHETELTGIVIHP
ncbi:hypothetical protein FOZ62_029205 [Perkinsus olseni]|uniref:Uncharacterized protein n=1 Tax=Perkinsus olseni TaxID=32597 RepID=A0A7J6RAD6_PEROL|nr:hypothetical protein FOZ62_029205 [Perkinsus olseni]